MAEIVSNLFGIDPAALQQQRARTDQEAALKYASLDDLSRARYGIALGARGIGRGINQLLGGDEEMNRATQVRQLASQFDMTSAEGIEQFAQAVSPFAPEVAQAAIKRRDEIITTGLKQGKLIAETKKAGMEKLGTPENQAEQAKFTELLGKYPDTTEGRAKAANDFKEWKSSFKQKEAAAGVAMGEAKIPDLRTAQLLVNDYLGKSKESLGTIKTIKNYAELIKSGNTSQLPQLQRALVKLVGDNQIGQNELRNILGSSGIASNIINSFTTFLTGAPTADKIDDVLQGVKVLEKQVQESYRVGQQQSREVLSASKFDPKIVDNLVGPALKTTPPAGGAKAVPALANWLTQARAANPNVSDAELTAYYNKKYPQPKSK